MPEDDEASLKAIARRIRRENAAYEAAALRRREAALAEAARLARAFAETDPELRRVLLFGSLLPGREYRMDSDIDLAAEGGDIFALMAVAESSPFQADVVELSGLRDGLASSVLAEGVTLYEKDAGSV